VAHATLHSADHRSSAPQKISFLWPHPFKFEYWFAHRPVLQGRLIETREPVLRYVCVTINVVLLAKLPVIYTSPPKKNKNGAHLVTSRP
jgi:hypothetical protein